MPLPITFGVASARGFGLFSAPVALLDEYFEYVTLLLPGNGTNGAQNNTFLDSSTNNFTITRNGNTTQGTFSPYGSNWSNYFDGSGDFLSTSISPATLSGDFTVEGWIYLDNLSLDRPFVCLGDTFHATGVVFYVTTGGRLAVYGNNVVILRGTTQSVPTNSWVHVAFVRSSGTIKVYLNGTADSTTVSNATSFAVNCRVGAELYNGGLSVVIQGYISSCRIVAGTAVYTSNFTPPTAPLTAITNTQLLTNFTNASIIDNAMMNDLETVGNAQISNSVSKFGGGSMAFDGTGDWLVTRYNPNLELGSGDFTVEAWVYFSTLPSNAAAAIVSYGDSDNTPRWLLYYDSRTGSANGLRFSVINGSGSAIILVEGGGTSGWAANTWYHVAVTRSGSSWKLFRDGTQTGSTLTDSDSIPTASNNGLVVGAEPNGGIPLTGYIDDLRITKGVARYTANFTPPTQAFPTR